MNVTKKSRDESPIQIEEAQAAIRDSVERAKELLCEAKERMRLEQAAGSRPPGAAD